MQFAGNKVWFQPECTGTEDGGLVGPSPRAFHVAVAIDCNMFIFGGRHGRKRFGPSPLLFALLATICSNRVICAVFLASTICC